MGFHLPKEMFRGSVWRRRKRNFVRFASLIRVDDRRVALETGRQAQERTYKEAMRRGSMVWGI